MTNRKFKSKEFFSDIQDKVRIRFKDNTSSNWSQWLIFPSDGTIEVLNTGPVEASEIRCIEILAIETTSSGRLLPPRRQDRSLEIEKKLKECGLSFKKIGDYFEVQIGKNI